MQRRWRIFLSITLLLLCSLHVCSQTCTPPAKPVITFNPSDTVCKPDPVTLFVDTATCPSCTYAWSTGETGGSIIVKDSASYSVTVSNACGTAIDSHLVVIKPLPNVYVTHTPTSICQNRFQLLNAFGAQTYTWSGDNLAFTTGSTNVLFTPQSGTVQLYATGTLNGCSFTRLVVLDINPQPNVNIVNQDTTICAGTSFKITATGASIYNWIPATGLNIETGATVTASPTIDTKYFVSGFSGNGCQKRDSIYVHVLPVLAPSVNLTYTGCPSNTLSFKATPTNGGATPQFKWFVNNVQATGTDSIFTLNNATNGTVIKAELTSDFPCINPKVATSSVTIGCIPTAVPDIDGLESFDIAPNPSTGLVVLKYNLRWARKVSFTVFNGVGQKVYNAQAPNRAGVNTTALQMSHLTHGVYYLQTMMDNKSFITKIIIQ